MVKSQAPWHECPGFFPRSSVSHQLGSTQLPKQTELRCKTEPVPSALDLVLCTDLQIAETLWNARQGQCWEGKQRVKNEQAKGKGKKKKQTGQSLKKKSRRRQRAEKETS